MDIPNFKLDELNPKLTKDGLGSAFQNFACEIIHFEYPKIYSFSCLGKDGSIDGIQNDKEIRTVIEYKHISKPGLKNALNKWKAVAVKLNKHLKDPKGPTRGQSQYAPWYRKDIPISEYLFVVSSTLSNLDQVEKLEKKISHDFKELAKKYKHLNHLGKIEVKVYDWNELSSIVKYHPHILFSWFIKYRQTGFIPFEESEFQGSFRSYLNNSILPFYSRSEHLKKYPAPVGNEILDENTLFKRISEERGAKSGLIIFGKGGVGKTKLAIQITHMAKDKGWIVFKVGNSVQVEDLDELAGKLSPEVKILLFIDYVETMINFSPIVDRINDLNDTYKYQIRYVATCRTSFYHKALTGTLRHVPFNILVQDDSEEFIAWFDGYNHEIVKHILSNVGIKPDDGYLKICCGRPIFAVFFSYLKSEGRSEDLRALLNEADFGRWVIRRIKMSFGAGFVDRNLAKLCAFFPLTDNNITELQTEKLKTLFDILANDGWIEKIDSDYNYSPQEGNTWVVAHDIISDQILISFCQSIPETKERFVRELFDQASKIGYLQSALYAIQRVYDEPEFSSLNWFNILKEAIGENKHSWKEIRLLIIRTPILDEKEKIMLLKNHESLWEGVECEVIFRNSLGYIIKTLIDFSEQQNEEVPDELKLILEPYLSRAVPLIDGDNYILSKALCLFPEKFSNFAHNWIIKHPTEYNTDYVINDWIKSGLDCEEIKNEISQYISTFSTRIDLQYLLNAWLITGQEKDFIKSPMITWLNENATIEDATFVIGAWLKSGGDPTFVQEYVKKWLDNHATIENANFVIGAWLKSGGDLTFVQEYAKVWLDENVTIPKAGFVLSAWLENSGDLTFVQEYVKKWLDENVTIEDAQFVLSAWLKSGGDPTFVQEYVKKWLDNHATIENANFVIGAWLKSGGDLTFVQEYAKVWLDENVTIPKAGFVLSAWLNNSGDLTFVQEYVKKWLDEHGRDIDADFLSRAWLGGGGDPTFVQEYVKVWLDEHATIEDAQFVLNAWLENSGDISIFQKYILEWLKIHEKYEKANYVYKYWLDSGGDKRLIHDHIKAWLKEHETDNISDYVYLAWLGSNGDFSTIKNSVFKWIHFNCKNKNAVYLLKHVIKQTDLPIDTIKDIFIWCRTFPKNEDTIVRFSRLKIKLYTLPDELIEENLSIAESLLKLYFDGDLTIGYYQKRSITITIFNLKRFRGYRNTPFKYRIDNLLLSWLRNPASFGKGLGKIPFLESKVTFQIIADFIKSGEIDIQNDHEAMKRFLLWVDTWNIENKKKLYYKIIFLERRYPDRELWSLVNLGT